MRRKPLIAVILAVCLCMAGCSFPKDKDSNEPNRVGFSPSEGIPETDWNRPPMDSNTLTASQKEWVHLAESFYMVGIQLSDVPTDLEKANFFKYIISTPLYEERLEEWKDEDGYAIPLSDIREIICTNLNTTTFDPLIGFPNRWQKWQYYDEEKEVYRMDSIGGYGGAAALGVLSYTEQDGHIEILLGSYQMEEFFSDPPVYILQETYEVEFLTGDKEMDFKVLKAGTQEMNQELEDADREQLLATAEILTQQVVNHGLERSNLFEEQNPSIDDRGIYRVLVSTVDYEENDSYLYHDFFLKKDEDYYLHFPSEKVRQMVFEVFGIENWTYLSNEMEYDAQTEEYFIMGDFGRETTLECTNMDYKIDPDNRELRVRYDLMTSSNFPDVRMIGVYETRFSIQTRPDGSHYLRYLETTKESLESPDETEGKPPLYEEPTEEELAELFCDAILEINNLATEEPYDVIRRRFGDVTIDSDDCIIIDEFPYARTSLDYSELVEYYANIFTDEALEWVLSTKFADVEGTMYCCLTGGQTGTGMQLHSIEKLREYTYQATFLSYYGIDETVGNSVVVVFEVKKTDAGYRISSTDYCPASLN